MFHAEPPRIAEWLLKAVLPKTDHATVIGELEEEFHASIVPLMGATRSKIWFWVESFSLIAGYVRVLLIREDSRDLTVIMTARRLRRRWGKQDTGKDRGNRIDSMIQDIRHGYKSLCKRPSFTLAAMLTLAIGIGVNTAIFSLLYAVLIKPLPFHEPDQLVSLHRTRPEWGSLSQMSVSYPDFVTWRDENRVFSDMAAYHSATINLTGDESPERLVAARVSYNLMSVLGIHPEIGREFRQDEDTPEAPGTVILSYGLWQRRLGGDRNIVGQIIHLDKEAYSIIGVAPAGFEFPDVAQLWIPLRRSPASGRDIMAFWVLGRMREDISLDQAYTGMLEVDARITAEFSGSDEDLIIGVTSLKSKLTGELSIAVIIFYVLVCLILLLACVNIANLMLALSSTRQTEIAIRSSLGAGRTRIARQLLTESVLLALAGGAIGMILGLLGRDTLLRLIPMDIPHYFNFTTSPFMVLIMIGIIFLTGIIFGVAPALTATRLDLSRTLQHGNPRASGSGSRNRMRSYLVVMQVSVATLMIVGSGLVMKSYLYLVDRDPGIDTERLLTLKVSLPEADYPDDEGQYIFFRDFTERVRAIPGVVNASPVAPFPFGQSIWQRGYTVEGQDLPEDGQRQLVPFWVVEGEYFSTMDIPVLQGSVFSEQDGTPGTLPVIVVTEAFALHHWPGENALGKRMKWGSPTSDNPWKEVIGIVGDIQKPDPFSSSSGGCYAPVTEFPQESMTLAIKTAEDPGRQIEEVLAALASIDRDLPAYEIMTMKDVLWQTYFPYASLSILFSLLTGIALVLSAVGIYGVVSYTVAQRIREFGIRIALGASRRNVIMLVNKQMARLAGTGLLIGLFIAFAGLRFMSSLLFGVSPTDPGVYLLTFVLMGGTALLSAYLPARKAIRANPIDALREE